MTKEQLMSYRSKKEEIAELRTRIRDRHADGDLIGNDVINDYRDGFPKPQSVVGFDWDKYQRAQEKDRKKIEKLESECEEVEKWVEAINDSLIRRIFRMTYIEGRKQDEVARAVHLDRSSVSKKINRFLHVSHNSQNSHL